MHRFPENTVASVEDFRRSGWKEVLSSEETSDYCAMWRVLSDSAARAIGESRLAEGKVLWLLADACSMMLSPSSANEPFRPLAVLPGGRSALPEDFRKEDIALLEAIVGEVDNLMLRARVADLLWILRRPREVRFALLAMDSYLVLAAEDRSWHHDGGECWKRAVSLAAMLRDGAGDRLSTIVRSAVATILEAQLIDTSRVLEMTEVMREHHLGRSNSREIASKLESLARGVAQGGDFRRTQELFEAAAVWFRIADDATKAAEMVVHLAESLVTEAHSRQTPGKTSQIIAAGLLEKAIQKYRSIPKKQRSPYAVDDCITKLRAELAEAQRKSLEELDMVNAPRIDITEIINHSVRAVRGKNILDAMAAFSRICGIMRVAEIRSHAEKEIRDYPILAMFSATHISHEGRAVAKLGGVRPSDHRSEGGQRFVWASMVKQYRINIGLAVQGQVVPALSTLRLEHRLREVDFVSLTRRSPFVPPERERLFGKGLFAGYDDDFSAALHLLVPQLENCVRWHLKMNGATTTTLDSSGVETENGLSALIEHPKTAELFGENLTFEIKALFCDPFGPNLRNEVAHGLLRDSDCDSDLAVYA